jgi:hypothetical protein
MAVWRNIVKYDNRYWAFLAQKSGGAVLRFGRRQLILGYFNLCGCTSERLILDLGSESYVSLENEQADEKDSYQRVVVVYRPQQQ